jgi:hypothetical protein
MTRVHLWRTAGRMTFMFLVGTSGCHHRPSVAPLPSMVTYCWWSSQYLSEPPVSVVSRFQGALAATGFANARWMRSSDSAWATGGPSVLPLAPAEAKYAFRAVAYPARDTINCAWRGNYDAPVTRRPGGAESCFHTNVAIYRPRQGWSGDDSTSAESRVLPLCGQVYDSALAGLERLK